MLMIGYTIYRLYIFNLISELEDASEKSRQVCEEKENTQISEVQNLL